MLSIKEQLALLYCFSDDFFQQQQQQGQWRHSNNCPKFTDAEVITIALMLGYFQTASLKRAYLLVRANDPGAFPQICGYKQWVARLHALTTQIGQMGLRVALPLEAADDWYLIDSLPIRMCKPIRHGRVLLLRDECAYFGKSSTGWFFGFKLHVLATRTGQIIGAVFTPGNYDDREGARMLVEWMENGSLCLGDLGYRGEDFQGEMFAEEEVLFVTRADIAEQRLKEVHSTVRIRIESVFSGLWSRFATRVLSRSWLGLWNTLQIKMLDYKLCHSGIIPAA